MSFSDDVDAALRSMRTLLGSGDPPAPATPKLLSDPPAWPDGTETAGVRVSIWGRLAPPASVNLPPDMDGNLNYFARTHTYNVTVQH